MATPSLEAQRTELSGKTAVITGGSTGIGRATAAAFIARGMKVMLASRRPDRLQRTVDELSAKGAEVTGVPVDVANTEEVENLADRAFEHFGGVDVVFCNAGAPSADNLLDPNLKAWRAAVDLNVFGLLHCLHAFMPRLVEQGQSSILASTSAAGIHGTAYATAPYAATKAAQLSIMESLYGQVRDRGLDLHVGVVVPPMTRTNLAGDDLSVWEQVEAGAAAKGIPSALVEPPDVAQVIVEGLERRAFWIEPDIEQDERHFGGRTRAKIDHFHGIIQAKADSMIEHRPPDDYLW